MYIMNVSNIHTRIVYVMEISTRCDFIYSVLPYPMADHSGSALQLTWGTQKTILK